REMLDTAAAKIKHMIILSDGQTPAADHLGLTQAMADSGITVSTVSLGEGAARELMASIAEVGRGRYYETVDPSTVPQIFTKETMQASKSAIKEDLFGSIQSGDHPILSGYEEADLPFILGYVMTEAKPTAQSLLITETGDPLLAVSRFGLGNGLAYTSDLTENWGGEWLAWDGAGKFWAQVFRGIVRKSDATGLSVTATKGDDQWDLFIQSKDPDGSPVSRTNWDAVVLDGDGNTSPLAVQEVGLGRYRSEVPFGENVRRLSVRLHDRDSDKLKTLHLAADYPAEYRLSNQLPESIEALPAFVPGEIRDQIQPARQYNSVGHLFAFAALASLLAGMVLRRI
ncbi:MAG: glutamine amidotransferase, partial [Verrucomicrobiota bacterium]